MAETDPARQPETRNDSVKTDQAANKGVDRNRSTRGGEALRRRRVRRLTLDAVLIALALVLSIVERWIPLELIVPVPGIKLGLANIVTLFALLCLTPVDAMIILLARSLIMGMIIGPTVLFFSLSGGALALLTMWILSHWEGRVFSLIGLSIAGAAAHNIGQTIVAVIILAEPMLLLAYLPPLLLTSIVTGTLTGIGAHPIIIRFPAFRISNAAKDAITSYSSAQKGADNCQCPVEVDSDSLTGGE